MTKEEKNKLAVEVIAKNQPWVNEQREKFDGLLFSDHEIDVHAREFTAAWHDTILLGLLALGIEDADNQKTFEDEWLKWFDDVEATFLIEKFPDWESWLPKPEVPEVLTTPVEVPIEVIDALKERIFEAELKLSRADLVYQLAKDEFFKAESSTTFNAMDDARLARCGAEYEKEQAVCLLEETLTGQS